MNKHKKSFEVLSFGFTNHNKQINIIMAPLPRHKLSSCLFFPNTTAHKWNYVMNLQIIRERIRDETMVEMEVITVNSLRSSISFN